MTPLDVARGLLGAAYVWGGLDRAGMDCSGLVHLSYRALGIAGAARRRLRGGHGGSGPEAGAG